MANKKDVWKLQRGEIALINGKRYRLVRDFKKFMPGLGRVLNRELVNVETGKTQWFFRGIEVEIENGNQTRDI